ncbi:MAG TPA: NfeD family protein [Solirubrobacteraceae bacterium]|jgi:membrane protein implicated in regulation of membrane protease activity|nr:NfeD family protein [Solirubrobacteraceae bacterium]
MDAWPIWLIAACLLGLGEMHTQGLFLAPFALGALVGALASLVGLGVVGALGAFLVASVATLAVLRPVARRHRRTAPALRTGAAALVGREALVLERIANREGVGCVRIEGEVWTARAYEDDREIEIGERVQVVEIRGATAVVMR